MGFGEQISSEEKYRGYCICKKNETNYQIENSCPYTHTTEPPLSDSASKFGIKRRRTAERTYLEKPARLALNTPIKLTFDMERFSKG